MKKIILYSGAVLNFILAVFHAFFWPMLNWREELAKITRDNAGIVQVSNIIMIVLLLYFAVMSLLLSRMKKFDVAAKSIIILISLFYFLRLVLGYPFFGFTPKEAIIWVLCFSIASGYLSLLFRKDL